MNEQTIFTMQQYQTLALAGVFQAAALAEQLATHGHCDTDAMDVLIENVMNLDPEGYESLFPAPRRFDTGARLLQEALSRGQTRELTRPVSYALGLIHLTGRLRKSPEVADILRSRLESLNRKQQHFPDTPANETCNDLAQIWLDTIATFPFRIHVQGETSHLQDPQVAANIRTVFLAGVRFGFLWMQAGGRRWHLLFSRKRIRNDLNIILNTYT